MDDLEVLHRSLRDAPVEVKYVRLCVIIPDWCLVLQLNDALCVLVLPACQQSLVFLVGGEEASLKPNPSLITNLRGLFLRNEA